MIMGRIASDIEEAIGKAVKFLPKNFVPRHEHSRRCYNVLKNILYANEYTVIEAKQSLLRSFAPIRVVATNQRIIVVKPSFWSLWVGYNIFSPTKYVTIPYNNIINISLYTGMIFSSIHIHLNTMVSTEESDVNGLKTDDANAMFVFLEKMTEHLRAGGRSRSAAQVKRQQVEENYNYIDLETSRRLVKYKGSKFLWLGMEPIEYVADKLDVDKGAIIKVSSEELIHKGKEESSKLKGSILVCYNDSFSTYASGFLKKSYGIDTYILSGGIEYQTRKIKDLDDLEFKRRTEILQ